MRIAGAQINVTGWGTSMATRPESEAMDWAEAAGADVLLFRNWR